MKARVARLGLAAGLLVAGVSMTTPAEAWSCYPPADIACAVLGTACRAVDDVTGLGAYCTLY